MIGKSLFLSAALFAFTSPALATSLSCRHSFLTNVHYSGTAYGKKVSAVYAHAGALHGAPYVSSGQTFWEGVIHEPLVWTKDHFELQTEIKGSSGTHIGAQYGPVIQYWVFFTDGSSLKSDVYSVPVVRRESATPSIEPYRSLDEVFDEIMQKNRSAQKEEPVIDTRAVEVVGCSVG